MRCDIHYDTSMLFYLEQSETGDCYSFCMLIELKALLDMVQENGQLIPCGHDFAADSEIWYTRLPTDVLANINEKWRS